MPVGIAGITAESLTPNLAGSYTKGVQQAQSIQSNDQQLQRGQQQLDQGELELAAKRLQNFDARERQRLKSTVLGAVQLEPFLANNDMNGAANFLQSRIQTLDASGIDSSDTRQALDMLQSGDIQSLAGIVESAQRLVPVLQMTGDLASTQTKDTRTAQERNFERLSQLIDSGDLEGARQFKELIAPPKGTTVNVGGMQGEFDKQRQKLAATEFAEKSKDIDSDVIAATKTIQSLNQIDTLLEGIPTNLLTGTKSVVSQALNAIDPVGFLEDSGVTLSSDQIGRIQAAQNQITQNVLNAVSNFKGAVSDRDLAVAEGTLPGLSTTPEGRKRAKEMVKLMRDKAAKVQKLKNEIRAEEDKAGRPLYDMRAQLDALINESVLTGFEGVGKKKLDDITADDLGNLSADVIRELAKRELARRESQTAQQPAAQEVAPVQPVEQAGDRGGFLPDIQSRRGGLRTGDQTNLPTTAKELEAGTRLAASGASFGLGEEVASAVLAAPALLDSNRDFLTEQQQNVDRLESKKQQARETLGIGAIVPEVGGAILSGALLVKAIKGVGALKPLLQAETRLGRSVRAGLVEAPAGALFAAGEAQDIESVPEEALTGAVVTAVLGAGVNSLVDVGKSAFSSQAAKKSAKQIDQDLKEFLDPSRTLKPGNVPLTRGEKLVDDDLLHLEQKAKSSLLGEGDVRADAKMITDAMQNLQERQTRANFEYLGAGLGEAPADDIVGAEIKNVMDAITTRAATFRKVTSDAYNKASQAGAKIDGSAVNGYVQAFDNAVSDFVLDANSQSLAKNTRSKLTNLIKQDKASGLIDVNGLPLGGGKTKDVDVNDLESFRKTLNKSIDSASDKTQRKLLTSVKRSFDDYTNTLSEQGMVKGNDEAITLYQKARKLRSTYGDLYESDKAVKAIVEGADNITPETAYNMILGAAATSRTQSAIIAQNVIDASLKNGEAVRKNLRGEVLKRMLVKGQSSTGELSLATVGKRMSAFRKENNSLFNVLFDNPEDRRLYSQMITDLQQIGKRGAATKSSGTTERAARMLRNAAGFLQIGRFIDVDTLFASKQAKRELQIVKESILDMAQTYAKSAPKSVLETAPAGAALYQGLNSRRERGE